MSSTGHNTEVYELAESELDKVSGGEKELSEVIGAWYEASIQNISGLPQGPAGRSVVG